MSVDSINIEVSALESVSPLSLHDPLEFEEIFEFPASLAQVRFWKLDQLDRGNPAYNVAVRFELQGALNPCRLEQSFNEIVRRHEVLRTVFAEHDGEILQIVKPRLEIELTLDDLRSFSEKERKERVDHISLDEATIRFDLSDGPLISVRLLRTGEEVYVLLVNVHHAVYDGWSVGLLTKELAEIYKGLTHGSAPELDEQTLQYADFTVWQSNRLKDPSLASEVQFWSRQLRRLPLLDIPTDVPRPERKTFSGDILSFVLERSLTDRLHLLSSERGHTYFVTVLSALAALLSKYSGQVDIPVGTQVAGRSQVEVENLIGCFSNTVILRCNASGDPTFSALMERVRETAVQGLAHQDVPYELVLTTLNPDPDFSHTALYRVNFIVQRDFVKPLEFEGISLSALPSKSQGALYELNFFMVERPDGWRLSCEYNTGLFQPETVFRMLEDYRDLLEQVSADPRRLLSEYPALGKQDAKAGGDAAPGAKTYVASIAQQRFWMLQEVSSQQNSFNLLAALRLSGEVDPTALEESLRRIIGRHAVLRTSFELRNDQLCQIVHDEAGFSLDQIPVSLSEDETPTEKIEALVRSEADRVFDLARPPLLRAALFTLGGDDRILCLSMPHIACDGWSFSVLIRELRTLYEAIGGASEPKLDPLPLQYADFTISQQQWLQGEGSQESLDFWKSQLQGQDLFVDFPIDSVLQPQGGTNALGAIESALLPDTLTEAVRAFANEEETTLFNVLLAAYLILLSHYSGQTKVLVGSPTANRGPDLELLIGLFSNPICLRTDLAGKPSFREVVKRATTTTWEALSHGALPFEVLREEVTVRHVNGRNPLFQFYFFFQKAFLQSFSLAAATATPLPTLANSVLFELQLGVIQRPEGIRAELEYNTALFRGETIVSLLRDYIQILELGIEDPNRAVTSLPLNTSFALDRRARLPAAGPIAESVTAPDTAPAIQPRMPDAIEASLIQIWKSALKIDGFTITDDFFALGGHSLMAARIFAAIRKNFGRDLPLATLFEAATIEKLARVIRGDGAVSAWSALVPIRTTGKKAPLFLIHPVGGHVFLYRELAAFIDPDQPLYAFQAFGLGEGVKPHRTIEAMASHYLREVTLVQPHGPYYFGGYSAGGVVAFEMARQIAALGEQVKLLTLIDTSAASLRGPRSPAQPIPKPFRIAIKALSVGYQNHRILAEFGLRKYLDIRMSNFRRSLRLAKLRREPESQPNAEEAFMMALEQYVPGTYSGNAVLIRTQNLPFEISRVDRGWRDLIDGNLTILDTTGDHFVIFEKPYLESTALQLNRALKLESS